MRILVIHNRYQFFGGEDVVVQQERKLLEEHRHHVFLYQKTNTEIKNLKDKFLTGLKAIYSFQEKNKLAKLIKKFKPDIVHVHNFFPLLSPSIYQAAKENHIPIVQSLHNYRLICPNALLFKQGKICEQCLGLNWPYSSIINGCYRRSRLQTLPVFFMLGWHKTRRTWHKQVDAFIALSSFQKNKLVKGGLPAKKIFVKPNFLKDPGFNSHKRQNFALFVGRLSEEKGIELLVRAYKQSGISLPLKIVGDGPLLPKIKKQAIHLPIEILGQKSKAEIINLMHQAKVLVLPSIWYEAALPMVCMEALACGLPIIAFDNNSFAEFVEKEGAGWLISLKEPKALAEVLLTVASLTEIEMRTYREKARKTYLKNFTPEKNYQQLISIYEYAK